MDELTVHQTMSEALVARGLATSEQVAVDRAALQSRLAVGEEFAPAEVKIDPAPASATVAGGPDDDGSAISAAAFAGPATPAGYSFEPPPPGAKLDPEALKSQAAWRVALHAEGVPPVLAREMDKRLVQGLLKPPTAHEGALSEQAGMATLTKLWGVDRDRLLGVAKQEVQRLARHQPGLIDMLNRSGKGNDPWFAVTLVNMARAKGRA